MLLNRQLKRLLLLVAKQLLSHYIINLFHRLDYEYLDLDSLGMLGFLEERDRLDDRYGEF